MINQLSIIDDAAKKEDRVYQAFATWCDIHWKANPDILFYDVALAWTNTSACHEQNGVPGNGAGIMFKKAITLVCIQTRNDLNAAAHYDLTH